MPRLPDHLDHNEHGPLAAGLSRATRRHLRIWLWTGALLTAALVTLGGATRLTQSGLSIVEWTPLVGVIPPLSESAWEEAFAAYRQYPEYRQLRPGMTLAEYKGIFVLEYLHRLAARTVGLAFLIPFAVFWSRGALRPPLLRRLFALFGLGAAQGVMGWLMVASGLVERPYVDPLRLAAHLALAFAIFATCLWTAADLGRAAPPAAGARPRPSLGPGLALFGVLLALQVLYGALVAGLDAGYAFNTWPRMAGDWLPPAPWRLEPWPLNLVENLATVQWIHRWLALALVVVAVGLLLRQRRPGADPIEARWSLAVALLVAVQAALGVATLVWFVPIPVALAHQAVALALFGAWILWWHRAKTLRGTRPSSTHAAISPARPNSA